MTKGNHPSAITPRAFVRWAYIPHERRASVVEVLRFDAETIRTASTGEREDNIARDLHAAADALDAAGNLSISSAVLRGMRPAPGIPRREAPIDTAEV